MTFSLDCPFVEEHHVTLPSPSNMYSLKTIVHPTGNKVLVASRTGRVLCIDSSLARSSEVFPSLSASMSNLASPPPAPASSKGHWIVTDVPFTYIPGDAEIIALDCFTASDAQPKTAHMQMPALLRTIIGIAFTKPSTHGLPGQSYLNVYGATVTTKADEAAFDIEAIAGDCQAIPIAFTPFQLSHVQFQFDQKHETVFLLSGSDAKVHLYKEDAASSTFDEVLTLDLALLLGYIPSNVIFLDTLRLDDRTFCAFGCQSGAVQLTISNHAFDAQSLTTTRRPPASGPSSGTLLSSSVTFDGPITSTRLFTLKPQRRAFDGLNSDLKLSDSDFRKDDIVSLIVTCAIGPAVVYYDVLRQGLDCPLVLQDSDYFDAVLCSLVGDVDFDCTNEILLGTYGQQVLAYKVSGYSANGLPEFSPVWRRGFSKPIYGLQYVDITKDGMRELVVTSTLGTHILQHDLKQVRDKCREAMGILKDILALRKRKMSKA